MAEIDITLPDGSTRAVVAGTTALGLAQSIGSRLAKAAVIAEINGDERDLGTELAEGDKVAIITAESERGLYTIRHSTAHVLAQAVLDLFPGATFGIGPPVEDGFYYDFDLPGDGVFTPDDLDRVDARMREIIDERQAFVRDEIPADAAREIFAGHRFKLEIIDNASTDPMSGTSDRGEVRTYENPPAKPKDQPPFAAARASSTCAAPHVETTAPPRHSSSCACPAPTGAATSTPAAPAHLRHAWASARRSRRTCTSSRSREARPPQAGRRARLFHFPPESAASAAYHPSRLVASYGGLQPRRARAGRYELLPPHIAKGDLFKISGTAVDAEGMYPPRS